MNPLENESSPYLRQHADNPVDWYPWGESALAKARREDKPIVVSIGYSTCHWCHVMERESFEDEDVAAFMNEHFVSIKIDREERPDLDALYMDACQIIAGTSGWPLHVFLTPELKPFFAGTYFPPEAGHKRQSWFQALQYALYNFRQNRKAVEAQADRILARMKMAESGLDAPPEMVEMASIFTRHFLEKIYASLRQKFDEKEGGFGTGQKFPSTMALEFLLQYFTLTNEEEALGHVRFSLNKMMDGGLYDQVGGGIARYAVDRKWQVPHFEKMLYDNALFIQLLAKVYRLTGRRKYKTALLQSIRFLEREMMGAEGCFFSALDADSEGGEGRFYTWKKSEIEEVLGEDAELFCSFFGITEKGNWEGTNILRQPHERFDFSKKNGYGREDFRNKIIDLVEQVLAARQKRKAPHRDEKIILGWNALMVSAYVELYAALGEEKYRDSSEQLLHFLWQNFVEDKGKALRRTLTDGHLSNPATLQDYAFLIRAMLDVFQINFEDKWLERAGQLTEAVFKNFQESKAILFNFSPAKNTDLIYSRKDIKDDEMPSGNAMMVRNFQDLGLLLGREDWRKRAAEMLAVMPSKTEANPLAHAAWASAFLAEAEGVLEVAIIGDEAEAWAKEMRRGFVPFQVTMASPEENENHPLLAGKAKTENTLIYICRDYACQRPLESVEDFQEQFSKLHILSSKR